MSTGLTIREALRLSPSLPRLDREVLLARSLGQDRVFLMAHGEDTVPPKQLKRYRDFLVRAAKHEPIAYIVGIREFYGRDFFVGPGVLIPRPETELMVEHTIDRINTSLTPRKKVAVVDVGTGSGAIITSIFLSLQTKQQNYISFFAVESEEVALRYARKNSKYHHISAIRFLKSDLLARVSKQLSNYDEVFITANLPYLSNALYRRAAPNVKHFEPKSALVSGADGLEHYRRLITELQAINSTGVKINFFLEISPEQAKNLSTLFTDVTTLSSLAIIPDLAGKARLIIGVIDNITKQKPRNYGTPVRSGRAD